MAYQRTTKRVQTVARDVEPAPAPVVEAEDRHVVATDPYDERRDSWWRLNQLVYLIFGVLIALIGIRFVLLLLGANPDAGFTNFIYSVTHPFVRPFEGVFGAPNLQRGVFDAASLVAMVVYALVGWVIGKVIDITLGETRTGVHAHTSEYETHMR